MSQASLIPPARLVIASRESALAMWQAEHIRDRLRALYPQTSVSILGMTTQGDQILDRSLSKVGGKGLFVKELEVAMGDGRADLVSIASGQAKLFIAQNSTPAFANTPSYSFSGLKSISYARIIPDISGDDVPELVLASRNYDTNKGAVYVFFGISRPPFWSMTLPQGGPLLGGQATSPPIGQNGCRASCVDRRRRAHPSSDTRLQRELSR